MEKRICNKTLVSRLTSLALLFCAASLLAAPAAKKEPVAEGFLDWDGVTQKNWLYGRQLTPSDFRHRVVVYVAIDGKNLSRDVFVNLKRLIQYGQLPAGHTTQWETEVMPRESMVVISVLNPAKNLNPDSIKEYFSTKGASEDDTQTLQMYGINYIPVYKEVMPVGAEDISAENLPYVAVYGGVATEESPATKPLGTWNNYSPTDKFHNSKDKKSITGVYRAALSALGELNWKRPLGVAEPKFYAKVAADFEKGKPAQGLLNALKGGIKDKNSEKAREAQIMFDAINQYRTELKLRLACELHTAPARAWCDYMTLVKLFPSDKKSLQNVEAKFKGSKEIGQLGKILEKLMLWDSEEFLCKNAGEAKKIVGELQKMKKTLAPLAESQNAQIQGEAMVFASQVDALIETIPSKVVQK